MGFSEERKYFVFITQDRGRRSRQSTFGVGKGALLSSVEVVRLVGSRRGKERERRELRMPGFIPTKYLSFPFFL